MDLRRLTSLPLPSHSGIPIQQTQELIHPMTTQEIRTWLRQYNRSATWLAHELQISERTLTRVLTGDISPKVAWQIKKLRQLDQYRQAIPHSPTATLPVTITVEQLDQLTELSAAASTTICELMKKIICDHLDQTARQNPNP